MTAGVRSAGGGSIVRMTLPAGTRLGVFEVHSLLGAGGMGQVYRARDTKLGRDVALKLLPDVLAQDEEKISRLEREAHLLASLNHPNVATLHGFHEADGRKFLEMELVFGETLAERLARGALSVEEALDVLCQIAEALEAAHERGIIHRDLKPGNVKITPEGRVKVLDFGLAKAAAEEAPASDLSRSPTLTREGTEHGVILGTAAYMSPEQARGKSLDRRTDIWSFGCVLYEALAGRKAFSGETVSDTIARILEREPDWNALPERTPVKVRDLLRRCLQKDPHNRLRDVGDARIEIRECLSEPEAKALVTREVHSLSRWVAALGILAAVATAILSFWVLRRPEDAREVARLTVSLPPEQSLGLGPIFGSSVALSPDGSRIAYSAGGRLYSRSLDSLEGRPLPGTEHANGPFFSPDGQWVAFFAGLKLKKVSLAGGAPVVLADAFEPTGGSWGEDDTIVFGSGWDTGLARVSASGGTSHTVLPSTSDLQAAWPHVLPGARAVLFTLYEPESEHVAVLSLETGEFRKLTEGAFARYVNGYLVYMLRGSLMAVPFDAERLELDGTSVPVVESVRVTGVAHFAVSADGDLAYVPGQRPHGSELVLMLVDRKGSAKPLSELKREFRMPRFSPDGTQIAVLFRENENNSIWIFDLRKSRFDRLSFEQGYPMCPVWSADGKRVAFRQGSSVFSTPADGSGSPEILFSSPTLECPGDFSPRESLMVIEEDFPEQADIAIVRLDGTASVEAFTHTPSVSEFGPRLSPDGRWVAYTSNESGQMEVYVQPFPGGVGKWQVSSHGGTDAVWSRDGSEIFYLQGNVLFAVAIETDSGFNPGPPKLLFEWERRVGSRLAGFANMDVSPDGKTFVMVEGEAPVREFHVVLNWIEELNRL